MYTIPFYFHIWKNSPYIQLGLVNITKKSVFRLPISDYSIFFSKTTIDNGMQLQYGSWACKRSMCVNYSKNPLKTFLFLQNCNFFMAAICKYEAKTQKQKKIWQSLFGNYYSAPNYLSNDTQNVFFFFVLNFLKKNPKIFSS